MFPVHETNQNAGWNTLPFSICKIIQDVSQIDTNLSDQLKISVQVFCPTCLLNPYEKRNIPWKGNDNVDSYWKPDVARYHQSNCRAGTKKPKTFKEIETNAFAGLKHLQWLSKMKRLSQH